MFRFANKKIYKEPTKNYFNDLYFRSITNSSKRTILIKPNFYVEEILENDDSDNISNNSDNSDIENNIRSALTTYNNIKYCIFCASATFIFIFAVKNIHFNKT